jgi:hypothetical protein
MNAFDPQEITGGRRSIASHYYPLIGHHGPRIPKGSGFRELTDILLSYEHGSILIESKTLTILQRSSLPGRTKLAHDVSHHVKKAINQLRGGIRRLKDGTSVTSKAGVQLSVERTADARDYPYPGR